MKITDEQITQLERALDIKLLNYQKELIKRFIEADKIVIPRHHSYSYTLQMLMYAAMLICSDEKEKLDG